MDFAQAHRISTQVVDALKRMEMNQAGVATASPADRRRLTANLERAEESIARLKARLA